MIDVEIEREPIRLSQFLKLANIVQDGLDAKIMILNGEVKVNGHPEKRRGCKLRHGDRVQVGDQVLAVKTGIL